MSCQPLCWSPPGGGLRASGLAPAIESNCVVRPTALSQLKTPFHEYKTMCDRRQMDVMEHCETATEDETGLYRCDIILVPA